MVSREEVLKAITEITGGSPDEEFTKNAVKERLHTHSKRVDEVIEELLSEGVIAVARTRGKAVYYKLAKGDKGSTGTQQRPTRVEPVPTDGTLKALRDLLDEYFKRYFEAYFGTPKTEKDLDRIYDQVKDRLGMTTIEILRQQMGMTLEQFLGRFRDYIVQNYELFPGGKEGIVLGGVTYGVVRRKV